MLIERIARDHAVRAMSDQIPDQDRNRNRWIVRLWLVLLVVVTVAWLVGLSLVAVYLIEFATS